VSDASALATQERVDKVERATQLANGGTKMNGSIYLLALLIGVIAGLRALTAPAVIAWAVHFGWLDVTGTWLAFLGGGWIRWGWTVLALGELFTDQLPATPSRTVPMQFVGRLATGALSGAAIGASADHAFGGAAAGIIGAVIGTLGGARVRARLAGAFHNDHPAALIEDVVAIGGALLIGIAVR
jgi:uncharacterized membrane protein